MKSHRQPQHDAGGLRVDTGRPKSQHGAEVIDQHRGDQSSRRAAQRIASSEPTSDAESEERSPGYAPQRDCRAGDFSPQQQLDGKGRRDQQRQPGADLDCRGRSEKMFHAACGRDTRRTNQRTTDMRRIRCQSCARASASAAARSSAADSCEGPSLKVSLLMVPVKRNGSW